MTSSMTSSSARLMRSNSLDREVLAPPTARQLCLIASGTILLILVGACIFSLIEHSPSIKARQSYENDLAALLRRGNFSHEQTATVHDIIGLYKKHACRPHMVRSGDPWEFWSSLYFTTVLISTVGYGDLAPETGLGKAAAVLISLIGIPLFLACLMPLSRNLVDGLTGCVRRRYITRAVERAMHAVTLSSSAIHLEDMGSQVDFSRRMPDETGVGLNHAAIWRVELATLVTLILLIFFGVLSLGFALSFLQEWPLSDAYVFIWYTLTTIGLGDNTVELRHPLIASLTLVVLILVGASAARALICAMHRISAFTEEWLQQGPCPRRSSEFSKALDPIVSGDRGGTELLTAGSSDDRVALESRDNW